MRTYIAGVYSAGDQAVNVRNAILAMNRLMDAGHAPHCPHLTHFAHMLAPRAYEDWIRLALVWVGQCEALVRLPGESPGADREVAEARRLGLPVFEGVDAFLEARANYCGYCHASPCEWPF